MSANARASARDRAVQKWCKQKQKQKQKLLSTAAFASSVVASPCKHQSVTRGLGVECLQGAAQGSIDESGRP